MKQKNKRRQKERNQEKEINDRLIKYRIIRDIGTLFEQKEEKGCYKPKRVNNFWNNNYIESGNNSNKNRNLSLDEHLKKIKPYVRNTIIDLQNSDTWKIQLTIAINFLSIKDAKKERVMHSRSDNMKFTSYTDANKVVDKLLDSFRSRYQVNLETSIRRSHFIFDSVQLMYYKCHEVNFKHGDSYIDSPYWIKKEDATINSENEDDKCLNMR